MNRYSETVKADLHRLKGMTEEQLLSSNMVDLTSVGDESIGLVVSCVFGQLRTYWLYHQASSSCISGVFRGNFRSRRSAFRWILKCMRLLLRESIEMERFGYIQDDFISYHRRIPDGSIKVTRRLNDGTIHGSPASIPYLSIERTNMEETGYEGNIFVKDSVDEAVVEYERENSTVDDFAYMNPCLRDRMMEKEC